MIGELCDRHNGIEFICSGIRNGLNWPEKSITYSWKKLSAFEEVPGRSTCNRNVQTQE